MKNVLSVCIVAYRDYDEVLQAIETLNQFTPSSMSKHIVIVDNSGNSIEVQNEFKNRIQGIKDTEYIDSKANLGFGKGHNYIISKLDSEYHCIMNPDILFREDAFTPIITYMEAHPDVGMVIPNLIDEKGDRQLAYRKELTVIDMFIRMFCKNLFKRRYKDHTLQNADYTKPFHIPFGQGSFLVIRTKLFKELEGFDEGFFMYLEDADLCRRVNCVSKLMFLPDATVIHKWKQESHRNKNLFKIHVQSMRYYFNKWGYKWI